MGIPPTEGSTEVVKLQNLSVARLLFELLRARFTGTLEMSQDPPHEGQRTVWFRGGMPVFTDWFDERDVLGQIAVEQGVITEDELRKALEHKTAGQLLGDVLGKMGAIDGDKLRDTLRAQCRRKLVHLFELKSGQMVVRSTEHEVGKGDGLGQINVLELVLGGVAEHYDEVRVTLEMGKEAQGPVTATGALGRYAGHFRFGSRDKPILQALARGSSIDHLERLEGVSRQRAAQIVFVLWSCQMLETGTAPAREAHITEPMTQYVEAIRRRKGLEDRALEGESGEVEELGAKMKAERALKAQRYSVAHEAFLSAAQANPGDGEVAAGLVWSRYQLSARAQSDAEEALRGIAKVAREHPRLARGHYYQGVILEALGRENDASASYKVAGALDPHLKDAFRRARALAGESPARTSPKMTMTVGTSTNPLLQGRMPMLLVVGGVLIGGMLLANIIVGLDW